MIVSTIVSPCSPAWEHSGEERLENEQHRQGQVDCHLCQELRDQETMDGCISERKRQSQRGYGKR